MMEKTMQNMDLVLSKIESELNRGSIRAVETLAETYYKLLERFYGVGHDFKDEISDFIKQLETLNKLKNEIDTEIEDSLIKGRYVSAFNLTTIANTIIESIKYVELLKQNYSNRNKED